MKNIRQWFENKGNITRIEEFDGTLELVTNNALFMVVPGDDNGNWMLRVAPFVSFDRWANSIVVEEFFDDEDELVDYLQNHEAEIYKELFTSLSEEYDDLENEYDDLKKKKEMDSRRNAEWIFSRDEKGFRQCKCSHCLTSYGDLDTPFCPNCGKKMNKGNRNDV